MLNRKLLGNSITVMFTLLIFAILTGYCILLFGTFDHDEIMYVLEGGFSMGKRQCGVGTVVYLEADTKYGFEVWEEGVRFLNIRQGHARYAEAGQDAVDPYSDPTSGR